MAAKIVVESVEPGSEAARIGLRPGDVIVAYHDRPVLDLEDLAQAIVEARQSGVEEVRIFLQRQGTGSWIHAKPGPLGVTCRVEGGSASERATGGRSGLAQYGTARSLFRAQRIWGFVLAVVGCLCGLAVLTLVPNLRGLFLGVFLAGVGSVSGLTVAASAEVFLAVVNAAEDLAAVRKLLENWGERRPGGG